MITFKKFSEMFESANCPRNLLREQAFVLLNCIEDEHTFRFEDATKVTEDAMEWLYLKDKDTDDMDFNGYLGGDVFICEQPDDLKEVEGCDMEFAEANNDRWPNLTDMAMAFDVCDYVLGEPKFVAALLCWNNAGGPIYYIPEALWTENVINSVKLTNEVWASPEKDVQ